VLNEHIDPIQGRVYKGQVVDVETERIKEKQDRLMIGEPVKQETERAVRGGHEKAISIKANHSTSNRANKPNRSQNTRKN
jgi:hypothetical protein